MPRLRPRVAKAAGDIVGRRSLADQARADANGPGSLDPNATQVPPATQQALVDAGMTTGGFWSPGQPLQPYWPVGNEPRAWDFQTGYNVASRPRSTSSKAAFETLRNVIDAYDIARICIEHKQDDVRSLEWRIVPKDGATEAVQSQIDKATKFWSKPDGVTPFDSWQSSFLEDVFRYDAGCLYKQRLRGGAFGALEVLDGTTIAPLLDYYGRRPLGDAPAFIQWLHGAPAMWLREGDIVYQPFRMQPNGPYGLPPIEWLLLNVNTDIRFQWHFLNYFTEGSLPAVFMQAPPDMSNADQVAEFQSVWNTTMEGDQAQKWKVKWIPAGAKPEPMRETKFDPEFPRFLMGKTAAAFKVTLNDLGFTDDVNRATGETQIDVQSRIGKYPTLKYLEGIYTDVTNDDLGCPDVRFEFDRGEEKEDRVSIAQAWNLAVKGGAASVDEWRNDMGLATDPSAPTPRFVETRNGLTPLKDLLRLAGEEIDSDTYAPKPGTIEPDPDDPEEAAVQAAETAAAGLKATQDAMPEPDPTDPAAAPAPAPAGSLEDTASVDAVEVPGKEPDNTPTKQVEADSAVAKDLRAFVRFAKSREGRTWRDFEFVSLDEATALALNATGRRDPARARGMAQTLARRSESTD